ncbi:MAG: alpha-ketoacid dehydrogenase subunit beta [Gammaproteobacteria bacterium]
MRELPLIEAVREAYVEEMNTDDTVYMVGQDIRGGIYPHTKDLVDEFGEDRIVDTPISEVGMFGCAFGSALVGYRPIVDFMFGGFAYVAGSEVLVTLGQQYFLHGSQTPVPLVLTAGVGTGMRLANDHSLLPKADLIHHPGLKYVFPSTPHDAKGLMKSAIRDNNPVVFFWHFAQMMDRGPVPEEEYYIPIGEGEIKREGTDITVFANGLQYKHALQVAEKLEGEISVEIYDPRSFEPFDLEKLLKSLEKTNHLVVVDEDYRRCGFAAEVIAQINEHGFDLLDAPVARVTLENTPIPGGILEPLVCPTPEKIEASIRQTLA